MKKEREQPINFEDEVPENPDEVDMSDLKIDFSKFFVLIEMKLQHSLIKENVKDGILQYRMLIQHLELLARANGTVNKKYDECIKEYQETEEFKSEEDRQIRELKLAQKKLFEIYRQVFSSSASTAPAGM